MTSTKNLVDFQQDVPFSELCNNPQGRLWIATNMGMRYLRMDCLCVIQDSPSDRSTQSALMASIYANSNITICVAVSSSSSDQERICFASPSVHKSPLITGDHLEPWDTRAEATAGALVRALGDKWSNSCPHRGCLISMPVE